jgi:hypothetical protein
MRIKTNFPEPLGYSKGCGKRKVYIHECLQIKKSEKFQISNLTIHLHLIENKKKPNLKVVDINNKDQGRY